MNFKILFFLMMISISCTDGQENVVKSPELQTEAPNSNSDSNSTEETSGNTSENSNSDSDSSTESNSTNDDYETTTNMNQTYFIDEEIGFIAGDGVVLKTNNGGQTWTSIKEDKNIKFRSIHFENKSIGLVGGNDGFYSYVYLTNNGGLTWEQIGRFYAGSNYVNLMSDGFGVLGLYGDDNSKNIVLLLNTNNAGHGENNRYGLVYSSNNTGQDWTIKRLEYNMNNGTLYNYDTPYITSSFLFDNKVLLISRELNEYYTNPQVSQLEINFFNDGIIEIERNLISSSEEYFHIQDVFYNSEFGFFCGDNGLYSVSSDLVKNWTSRVIEGYEDRNFTSIYFNSNSEGILATDKGEILMSTDNGQSWSLKYDLGKKINDIKFLNQNKFIVIGDEGLLEILEF